MRIEFHAEHGEQLTPLEVLVALVRQETFTAEELKELAEYAATYANYHKGEDAE